MATMVGAQPKLSSLLNDLLELDFDAIEAYRAAIDRLTDSSDRSQLAAFMADHERHTRDLTPLIQAFGGKPSTGPDVKQWLTKGKVVIMGLGGDRAILVAMRTNEDDTNRAYERAVARDDLPQHVRDVLTANLADERRHREWIQLRLDAMRAAHPHP